MVMSGVLIVAPCFRRTHYEDLFAPEFQDEVKSSFLGMQHFHVLIKEINEEEDWAKTSFAQWFRFLHLDIQDEDGDLNAFLVSITGIPKKVPMQSLQCSGFQAKVFQWSLWNTKP